MIEFILFFSLLYSTGVSAKTGTLPSGGKNSIEVSLGKVVDKLQKAWDATKSYQTTFKQTVFSKRLGTNDESSGMLYVIKPNKLRWEAQTDGSMQILNGNKLWVIQENKRRQNRVVDIYPNVSKAVDAKPLNFLAGKAKFRDLYNIKLVSETPEIAELKLTPKDTSVESFVAEIDKASYLLRSLVTDTSDSRVKIVFADIRTNLDLDEALFDFKPSPKDIIHNQ